MSHKLLLKVLIPFLINIAILVVATHFWNNWGLFAILPCVIVSFTPFVYPTIRARYFFGTPKFVEPTVGDRKGIAFMVKDYEFSGDKNLCTITRYPDEDSKFVIYEKRYLKPVNKAGILWGVRDGNDNVISKGYSTHEEVIEKVKEVWLSDDYDYLPSPIEPFMYIEKGCKTSNNLL